MSGANGERPVVPLFGIWTRDFDSAPVALGAETCAELEALGYGAVWVPEVVGRDPFTHLALLLQSTTSLLGATGIANIWGRDAVAMRAAATTLNAAYPSRVILGLGVSHAAVVDGIRGQSYRKPLATVTSYLDRLDAAPNVGHGADLPFMRVLAALGPRMLELAAARADGAHTYLVPTAHTAVAREVLGPRPLLCVEQAVVLETDPGSARRIGRANAAVYLTLPNYANNLQRHGFTPEDLTHGGSDRLIDAVVAWGTLDRLVARVQEHIDAGADHVCIQVLSPSAAELPVEQWRRIGRALATDLKPPTHAARSTS